MRFVLTTLLLLVAGPAFAQFNDNGVTAHRGNSGDYPENTIPAFQSAIDLGADWIELDIFLSKDGQVVVTHDRTTKRVGDRALVISESTYQELAQVDVATAHRRRTAKTKDQCPPQRIPLLKEVLRLVMKQDRTRVSIQPKMDCVAEAVALVKSLDGERWVGFNDGNLNYMAEVKRLAPDLPVFWDRGGDTDIDEDLRIAKRHGFEALVVHQAGVTPEKVRKIKAAGLEAGAWTVNDRATMKRMLAAGVQRLYTDYPRMLLALKQHKRRPFGPVICDGSYQHHLQGICVGKSEIYWSFTTTLVRTDLQGRVLKRVAVANHHGDLCFHSGRLYVAVNLGSFNDPQGNADSWVYVYDADSLKEIARHETQEVFHGAGGIGVRNDHFYVVGGLPEGVENNYVYEYDNQFKFLKRHVLKSGHTRLGIQTATFAHDRWWFGCYGDPKVLLVSDADFEIVGRYRFDCSLGVEGLPDGRLFAASGRCDQDSGCKGSLRIAVPDASKGLKYVNAEADAKEGSDNDQ